MFALDALRFITVFGMAIGAGTLVAVLAGVIPVLRALGDREALHAKQLLDPLIDRYQPATVALATIAGVAILFWNLSTAQYAFTAVGIAGGVGVAVTSLGFNVRINKTMSTMSLDPVAPEFRQLLARWSRFHVIRTTFALTSLTGYLVAVLHG
jgi:Domain of unknown function (DUF1772)